MTDDDMKPVILRSHGLVEFERRFLRPSAERYVAERDEIKAEIERRGTYWAADEIQNLRREVKRLAAALERAETSS